MTEKTYDGAQILGDISGLGKEKTLEIFEEVKANQKRLAECVGPHQFEPIPESEGGRRFAPDQRCQLCKGTVSSQDARWYKLGLEHGARGG